MCGIYGWVIEGETDMATIIKTAADPKTSSHIGNIGDRVRVEGKIVSMFGSKPIMHIIADTDGNQFLIRRNSALGSKPGVLVTIEADVLEHRIYRDTKQTVLSAGKQEVVGNDHPMLAKNG